MSNENYLCEFNHGVNWYKMKEEISGMSELIETCKSTGDFTKCLIKRKDVIFGDLWGIATDEQICEMIKKGIKFEITTIFNKTYHKKDKFTAYQFKDYTIEYPSSHAKTAVPRERSDRVE